MKVKFDIGFGSDCPHCKVGTIDVKKSKFGNFYGCSMYPYCAFSQKIEETQEEEYISDDEEQEDSGLVFKSKYQ